MDSSPYKAVFGNRWFSILKTCPANRREYFSSMASMLEIVSTRICILHSNLGHTDHSVIRHVVIDGGLRFYVLQRLGNSSKIFKLYNLLHTLSGSSNSFHMHNTAQTSLAHTFPQLVSAGKFANTLTNSTYNSSNNCHSVINIAQYMYTHTI